MHAGDMTNAGTLGEFKKFRLLMESLPHKHKIVIAGLWFPLSFDHVLFPYLLSNNTHYLTTPDLVCRSIHSQSLSIMIPKQEITNWVLTPMLSELPGPFLLILQPLSSERHV